MPPGAATARCGRCSAKPLGNTHYKTADSHPCCPVTPATPLQTLAPIWEELADELHGKVNVGKVGRAV